MPAFSRDIETFIDAYLKELRENNAAVFIGAGLSKSSGYVDWVELLEPIANDLGLDSKREIDLIGLAQFHLNKNANNRHTLNQLLIDQFSDLKEPSDSHKTLARLPISTYWTTNYDRLIERALESGGKRVDAKYEKEQLATTKRGRDAIVYKMHGDVDHSQNAVLTKDDYERYHHTHATFITALSGDLVEKTFLFLGFSFTDPNLDHVLSRVRFNLDKNQRQHFCLVKLRTRLPEESEAEYQYAIVKQDLITQDFLRFNIKAIFVENYSDIPLILASIEKRYKSRTIFISGSAASYDPWGRVQVEDFLTRLSSSLIDQGYTIASGFGLGVGAAVVTGAVQQIYSTKHRSIDEQLVLRPFPIGISDSEEREITYARYREELIARAGIGIFLFGNKSVDGRFENAGGVKKEFELAKNQGLFLIPVGATGSMASELWEGMMANYAAYYASDDGQIKALISQLGKPVDSLNSLIDPLLSLVKLLTIQ